MTTRFILALALLSLAPSVLATDLAAPADDLPAGSSMLTRAGCSNYGNQVSVGSSQSCDAGSECRNHGSQIFVASSYECGGGECPNDGIRAAVASTFCGHDGTYFCLGDVCTDGKPPRTAMLPSTPTGEGSMALEWARDCIPSAWTDAGLSISLRCDPSGNPCGINGQPVCWLTRYACHEGVNAALRAYDNVWDKSPVLSRMVRNGSECETQPQDDTASPAASGFV